MKSTDYETESSPAFEGKVMCEIMESFAGHIAEKKIGKRANNIGAYKDFENAVDLAYRLYGGWDKKLLKHLQNYLYRKAELLVEQKWNFIKVVAKGLLKKEKINRDEFYEIVEKEMRKEIAKINRK